MLASVVGAYYYLRIVKIMFFDEPSAAFLPVDRGDGVVMAVSALFVLLFVLAGAAGRCGARAARALHAPEPSEPNDGRRQALPPGCTPRRLDEVDSTNREAMRRVQAGERGPLWIMARRQTAGRGRSGRHGPRSPAISTPAS